MNVLGQAGINAAGQYPQTAARGQNPSADEQNIGQDARKYKDQVTLSHKEIIPKQSSSGMGVARFDVFGGAPAMLPPVGAGNVEEWAYRREGIPLNTSTTPPTFKDSGNPLNFKEWQEKEKEIDKFVEQRVEIYNSSKAQGLSDEEILQRLRDFNSTIPSSFSNFGEPYAKGFKVEHYDPSLLAGSLESRRQTSYKMMTNYLSNS